MEMMNDKQFGTFLSVPYFISMGIVPGGPIIAILMGWNLGEAIGISLGISLFLSTIWHIVSDVIIKQRKKK